MTYMVTLCLIATTGSFKINPENKPQVRRFLIFTFITASSKRVRQKLATVFQLK